MVGNDIVDISQTRLTTNWRRRGFLHKVFTYEEQEIIAGASDPFIAVWRMWSMKESAYKLYMQQGHDRFFNPSKIACCLISEAKGEVSVAGQRMQTHTEINSNYIFTTATLSESDRVENSIFYLSNDEPRLQSETTHQQLLQHIATQNGLEIDHIQIRKTSQNIPHLFYQEQPLPIPVSLTHHGNYGAFSIQKDKQ